ncbi:hypothetical protein BDZ94DRAFT_1259210 [Collybia nuda]|uniref:Uncharacterized protein n=1 Tax=Collybia nuda TaxID=64659 RepID=A0A9P5Y6W2_9AGAR|nr:hypothetical protein BDZ94DRAFT_1259210 [Collybia nuda]
MRYIHHQQVTESRYKYIVKHLQLMSIKVSSTMSSMPRNPDALTFQRENSSET